MFMNDGHSEVNDMEKSAELSPVSSQALESREARNDKDDYLNLVNTINAARDGFEIGRAHV